MSNVVHALPLNLIKLCFYTAFFKSGAKEWVFKFRAEKCCPARLILIFYIFPVNCYVVVSIRSRLTRCLTRSCESFKAHFKLNSYRTSGTPNWEWATPIACVNSCIMVAIPSQPEASEMCWRPPSRPNIEVHPPPGNIFIQSVSTSWALKRTIDRFSSSRSAWCMTPMTLVDRSGSIST